MAANPAFERTMRIDISPSSVVRRPVPSPVPAAGIARPWRDRRVARDTPFYQLLESVYDAVIITDAEGAILEANARATEFFRLDFATLMSRNVVFFISGATPALLETIHHNLLSRKFTLVDARAKRSDGTSFPAEIAINALALDEVGELSFFFRDITVRTEAQHKLQDAVERLEAQDRARLEFVSNCSHELRTPLTSMIYAVGNMLSGVVGPIPDRAVEYLERLQADSKRLLATVNDILDVRQIENRQLVLTRGVAPLAALVRNGADPALVQADAKKVAVSFELGARELFASVDVRKMERVVLNIVGNAVKFTPPLGTVTVRLAPVLSGAPAAALLTVDDTGPGVSAEDLPKLTRRYFHVGEQVSGSGLGLSISREIVELHGGVISFASPVPGTGKGTRVEVRLPLSPAPLVLAACEDSDFAAALAHDVSVGGYGFKAISSLADAPAACRTLGPAALVLAAVPGAEEALRDPIIRVRDCAGTKFLTIVILVRSRLARADLDLARAFNIVTLRAPWSAADLAATLARAVLGPQR